MPDGMELAVHIVSDTKKFLANEPRRAGDDLFAAYPPPEWDVVLSLPAVQATALVLVDYALYGGNTPTSWPKDVAKRVPTDVESEWRLLRPLIAHGTVWRDFVLFKLDGDDAAQRDRSTFRAWTAALTDDDVRNLVVEGVLSGLRYYRDNMTPMDTVERYLEAVGTRVPERASLTEPDVLRAAVGALAASWSAPVDAVMELAFDAPRLRAALLSMLDAVWENGFGEAWGANLPRLRRAAGSATRRLEEAAASGNFGTGGRPPVSPSLGELVLTATGRQLASSVLDQMSSAGRIVFFPGIELGEFISVEEAGYGWPPYERPREWRIFYEPLTRAVAPNSSRSSRTYASAMPGDLAAHAADDERKPAGEELPVDEAATVLEALGDRTRLAIVQSLHAHGEMFTGEVAERLGVHASTASRHLAQLEAAQLVRVRRDGKLKFYSVEPETIRAIAAFLHQQFG